MGGSGRGPYILRISSFVNDRVGIVAGEGLHVSFAPTSRQRPAPGSRAFAIGIIGAAFALTIRIDTVGLGLSSAATHTQQRHDQHFCDILHRNPYHNPNHRSRLVKTRARSDGSCQHLRPRAYLGRLATPSILSRRQTTRIPAQS